MIEEDRVVDWQALQEKLEQARWKILRLFLVVIVLSVAAYPFNGYIMAFLTRPIARPLAVFAITEAFWIRLKISFFSGLVVAMPYLFLELWNITGVLFNPHPLYQRYRRYLWGIVSVASLLFILGCLLAFFVVLPAGLQFLLGYGGEHIRPAISVDRYITFCIIMILSFGLAFQLPLILLILGRSGVVNHKLLAQYRRYAILILAIAAAVLTPTPDAYNMLLLAGPLVGLYEISVWLVRIFGR